MSNLRHHYLQNLWKEEASRRYLTHDFENKKVTAQIDSVSEVFCDNDFLNKTTTQTDYGSFNKLVTCTTPIDCVSAANSKINRDLITFWTRYKGSKQKYSSSTSKMLCDGSSSETSTLNRLEVPGATSESFKKSTLFSTPIELCLDPPQWAGWGR